VLKVDEKDSKHSCMLLQLYTSCHLMAAGSFLKLLTFFTEKSLTVMNFGGMMGFGLAEEKNMEK
jgi:hypothetical protein